MSMTVAKLVGLGIVVGLPASLGAVLVGSASAFGPGASPLGPVPVPVENPITEEKRVLGKILYWDEQLSSDNTVSCGTCHIPSAGGAEPAPVRIAGADLQMFTMDDVVGSAGVIRSDANNEFVVDPEFGLQARVTGRAANSVINSAFSPELFWDGRATSQFIDPETGNVSIASGGALESQVVGPPLSDVEMAHGARNWTQITQKLSGARPLALATNIPADMEDAVIAANYSYPTLFQEAFGDGAITAERIAFAIATYERTLISDQSPFDDYIAGDLTAMSETEIAGWEAFQTSRCNDCHTAPLFTDNDYHNIGIRPIALDNGREAITGNPADRGLFKTPGLRNASTKTNFMHSGDFSLLDAVLFYSREAPHQDNLDEILTEVTLSPSDAFAVFNFISNALNDPRVVNAQFPFDRPTMRAELAANPAPMGGGVLGSAVELPVIIAPSPPLAGDDEFRVGVTGVSEGASLTLLVSQSTPAGNILTPDETITGFTAATGVGAAPVATAFYPIADDPALDGQDIYFQWRDEGTGAHSQIVRATVFCGTGGCSEPCLADVNQDGAVNGIDFGAWLAAFNANDPRADQNQDGNINGIDFGAWLANFNAGCD